MEFHHIRSHVNRAGIYIGNAKDDPRDRSSHLMIILFDCLLYNDQSLLHHTHPKRMEFLQKVLPHPITGRCEFANRVEIDFAQGTPAVEKMRTLFASGIVKRWEGFVLKPIDEPYLELAGQGPDGNGKSYGWTGGKSAWIKLKKDYIQGCGDIGDFAVIGGAADKRRGWERKCQHHLVGYILISPFTDPSLCGSTLRSTHGFPCWLFIEQRGCSEIQSKAKV